MKDRASSRAATRAAVMRMLHVNEEQASRILRSFKHPTLADIEALVPRFERERHRFASRCVYFVEAPSALLIKIGMTMDITNRMRALEMTSPVPLKLLATVPGYVEEEALLHARFAHLRAHGEWFHAQAELWTFIEGLPGTFR